MRDFTFEAYKKYLDVIKNSSFKIITFKDLLSIEVFPDKFLIIRHDVDRKPKNALNMAYLESGMDIKSTYYFRSKSHVYIPEIIEPNRTTNFQRSLRNLLN